MKRGKLIKPQKVLAEPLNFRALEAHTSAARIIIFCRVVDHFGDAGFCWRLSVALRSQGAEQVILVTDRPDVVDQLRGAQRVSGVTVLPWNVVQAEWEANGVPSEYQAHCVIEAFACDPPAAYINALLPTAEWLTLDYLATEPWADDVHGQLSPVPSSSAALAAGRRWVVPGFSVGSGGLLHGQWRHISAKERKTWRDHIAGCALSADTLLVMAFGYEDAPWQELKTLLESDLPPGFKRFHLWQPQGIDVPQAAFDEILQACDFNFVRGEDSFIRAHWAAAGPWQVPFIWQPYRQKESAHRHKLAGWMHQMIRHPALGALKSFHWAWNGLLPPGVANADHGNTAAVSDPAAPAHSRQSLARKAAWRGLAADWATTREQLHRACAALAGRPSLEENLFKNLLKTPLNRAG